MIEFFTHVVLIVAAIAIGIPFGVIGWHAACALGGWRSEFLKK